MDVALFNEDHKFGMNDVLEMTKVISLQLLQPQLMPDGSPPLRKADEAYSLWEALKWINGIIYSS